MLKLCGATFCYFWFSVKLSAVDKLSAIVCEMSEYIGQLREGFDDILFFLMAISLF